MSGVNKALDPSTCYSKSICPKIEIKVGDRRADVSLERTWTLESVCMLVCAQSLSCVQLFATPWTIAQQAPLSTGLPRQEYRNGLPFPSPGDLPDPRTEPRSPALQEDALTSEPPGVAEPKEQVRERRVSPV